MAVVTDGWRLTTPWGGQGGIKLWGYSVKKRSSVLPGPGSLTLTSFCPQRRNFTLAFQAAESVGIKCTLVSRAPLVALSPSTCDRSGLFIFLFSCHQTSTV